MCGWSFLIEFIFYCSTLYVRVFITFAFILIISPFPSFLLPAFVRPVIIGANIYRSICASASCFGTHHGLNLSIKHNSQKPREGSTGNHRPHQYTLPGFNSRFSSPSDLPITWIANFITTDMARTMSDFIKSFNKDNNNFNCWSVKQLP